jgi:hypothetical protein
MECGIIFTDRPPLSLLALTVRSHRRTKFQELKIENVNEQSVMPSPFLPPNPTTQMSYMLAMRNFNDSSSESRTRNSLLVTAYLTVP